MDGSALDTSNPYTARAGWGVWYGHGSGYNRAEPLLGPTQTSYRAELRAALHVVQYASHPTRVVTDCRAVADGLQQIVDGAWIHDAKRPEEDLWNAIER